MTNTSILHKKSYIHKHTVTPFIPSGIFNYRNYWFFIGESKSPVVLLRISAIGAIVNMPYIMLPLYPQLSSSMIFVYISTALTPSSFSND